MVEVTQADRDIASAIGVCPIIYTPHEVRSGMRDHTPFVQAFATHRIEAAKAERDRLRELPDEVVKAAMDRANAMARQTLEGAFRIVAIALADALESQP